MKITNTSRYSTAALTFLLRHVASLLEVDDYVQIVRVTNSRGAYRGRCWGREVLIRIGPPSAFPVYDRSYPGLATAPKYDIHDWIEAFVFLAAHEFQHSRQYKAKILRKSEIEAERTAIYVLNQYRLNREALKRDMAEAVAREEERASERKARTAAKVARQKEKTAARSAPENKIAEIKGKIAIWTRKRRLADTYLKKYQQALRREERRLARLKEASSIAPARAGAPDDRSPIPGESIAYSHTHGSSPEEVRPPP